VAWRQELSRESVEHLLVQGLSLRSRHLGQLARRLAQDKDGIGKTEPIGVDSGLASGTMHEQAHGIMGQQQGVDLPFARHRGCASAALVVASVDGS
jgi:hypothetical protein